MGRTAHNRVRHLSCLVHVPRWPGLHNREPPPSHSPASCSGSLQCHHMSEIRPLLLAPQPHSSVSEAQPGCRTLQNRLRWLGWEAFQMQVPGNYLCLCGKKLDRPHAFFLLVSPFLRIYTDHIDFESATG